METHTEDDIVVEYLARVYTALCCTSAVTGAGAILSATSYFDMGMLASIISLSLILALHLSKNMNVSTPARFCLLLAFGFFSGQSLGPLLKHIYKVDPATIVYAFIASVLVFILLSFGALFAEQGKFLFLGNTLVSIINTMAVIGLLNVFFQFAFIQLALLHIGTFVMGSFILYDTQNIIDKSRFHQGNVVQHSMDLYFDMLSLSRRLLVILILNVRDI